MKTVIVNSGQTLEDISLQEYGCIDGVVTLLQDNGLGMDDDLYPGQPVLIRQPVPQFTDNNRDVAEYIAANGNSPNAGVTSSSAPYTGYVEIDYWIDNYSE